MITDEQLHAIMPDLPEAKRAALLPFLTEAMTEFGIEHPPRAAAFLAQLAHESAQFRFMEEIWGPTAAQRRYEPQTPLASRLGNIESGDGFRFKGRGPIQITGRANYKRFGDLLAVDLVGEPARAALPELAFRIAGLFWSKKGLNELADEVTEDAFREITRRINGGFNGLAERQRFYATARTVLGVAAPAPTTRGGRSMRAPRAPEPVFERGWESIQEAPPASSPKRSGAKQEPASRRGARRKNTNSRARNTKTLARRRSAAKAASRTKRTAAASNRTKAGAKRHRRKR